MKIRLKELILILNTFSMSLEVDKYLNDHHIYLQSRISNLNIWFRFIARREYEKAMNEDKDIFINYDIVRKAH